MKRIIPFSLFLTFILLIGNVALSQPQRILGGSMLDLDNNAGAHVFLTNNAGSLGVNAIGAQPNTCALLDLVSTTKGLLVPRMTTLQELALCSGAPPEGLIVYNTNTHTLDVYNGTIWGASGWALTGNSGTNSAVNFLGTIDAQDLVIRTNNVEAMRVGTSSNVSIGTNSTSQYPLLVQKNFTSTGFVSDIGVYGNETYTPSGPTANHKVYGTFGQVGGSGALNLTGASFLVGAGGFALTNGGSSGSVSRMVGTIGSVSEGSAVTTAIADGVVGEYIATNGTTTNATNFRAQSFPSGGTTTNLRGLYVTNPTGGGTITNQFGIDMDQLTGAANNTAFRYNHATQPVLISGAGDVRIGGTPSGFTPGLITTRTATGTSGALLGAESQVIASPTASSTAQYIGEYAHVDAANANATTGGAMYGLWGGAELFSTATAPIFSARGILGELFYQTTQPLGDAASVAGILDLEAAGTVTNASGFRSSFVSPAGATITNLKLLNVLDLFSNSGTITNTYGLYIGNLTLGAQTNKAYSIYASDGATRNFINGRTGFGTGNGGSASDPKTVVDIGGSISIRHNNSGVGLNLVNADVNFDFAGETGFVDAFPAAPNSNVSGVANGSNGRILIIHKAAGGTLTFVNEDAIGELIATNRIHCMSGANVVVPAGEALITLMYSGTGFAPVNRWLIQNISTN